MIRVLPLSLLLILVSCVSYSNFEQEAASVSECEELGGVFLAEFNECEDINQEECEALEGEYKSCGSACRHTPNQPCTKQCVPFCKLN